MRHNSRLSFKTWQVFFSPLMLMFALLLFISPVAAQTTPETPGDIIKGLGTPGSAYVSDSVKQAMSRGAIKNEPNLQNDIATTAKNLTDKKHDTRIAVVGHDLLCNAAIAAKVTSASFTACQTSNDNFADDYAKFLQANYLSNPKPQIVVVVDAAKNKVGSWSNELTLPELQAINTEALSTFNTKGFAAGASLVAEKIADKISSNATGQLISTVLIVLAVILVVGGILAFMYFNTRKSWKQQIAQIQGLAGQVSNQVLNLSDTIEYLPDAVKSNARNIFSQASSTFSNANTSLRQLEGASPWAVMFGGGKYKRQMQMTSSQFETSRNALAQVQQTVDSTTHM